ncbi:MAG: FAD-dependent oxidoreductase [Dehalococcoidia bacterium]
MARKKAASKRHVIVGAGPAGLRAIETIRSYEPGSSITLIGDEPAYSRMVIPYYLAGDIEERAVFTGDLNYFSSLKVETMFGRRVTSIDPKAQTLTLDDRATVGYDDLLIATGSSATRPPIDGATLPGVQNMWGLQDARDFLARARPNSQVVIIGAGFIGLIILDGLHNAHHQVTFVELESHILPRMIDAGGAAIVEGWMKRHGVTSVTGTSVTEIFGRNGGFGLRLKDGRELEADSVVVATGIKPNLDFAASAGVKTRQGILVNNKLQTNIPNIYAAGDVAEGPVLGSRAKEVHAIQPTAFEHGRVAGANMAGQNVQYSGSLGLNVLDAVGLQVTSFGDWGNEADTTEVSSEMNSIHRRLSWKGDVIVGAIMVGKATDVGLLNDVGMVKGFIQTGTHLGTWKNYISENPLDLRKPYVATKVAQGLLKTTLTKEPAVSGGRGYRFPPLEPVTQKTPWHKALISEAPK